MNPAPSATTFWDLIDQLLAYSPRDAHAQRQRAAGQTGICRSRALPSLPDRQGQGSEQNGTSVPPGHGCLSPSNNPYQRGNMSVSHLVKGEDMVLLKNKKTHKFNLLKLNSHLRKNTESEEEHERDNGEHSDDKTESRKNENVDAEAEEETGISPDKQKTVCAEDDHRDQNQLYDQSRTSKSECIVNDLDIVYVKPKKIPSSDRLWRFALKNRKQRTDRAELPREEQQEMPSVRSNEVIYQALKQRLQEALTDKEKANSIETEKHKRKPLSNSKSADMAAKILTKDANGYGNKNKTHIKKFKSTSHFPVNASKPLRRVQESSRSPWVYDSSHADEGSRKINIRAREEISTNKELYNCIIKRRLICGNQLDILNKELVSKRSNARSVLNKDTAKKYTELKTEYLNLCYQEAALRHEIAILHSEIYVMQNKGFHKVPASIKTISLDSNMSKLQPQEGQITPDRSKELDGKPSLFPRLKTPRPLILCQAKKSMESFCDRLENKGKKRVKKSTDGNSTSPQPDVGTSLPSVVDGAAPQGVCSFYSLTPTLPPSPSKRDSMVLQEKKSDDSLGKLSHRLPKMVAPTRPSVQHTRLQINIKIET